MTINDLSSTLEKQAVRIQLLEEELRSANEALEEKSEFAAALEQDLEHAITRLQQAFLREHTHS